MEAKVRALWLKWGDQNMKFFHTITSQRKRKKKKKIVGLQNKLGEWKDD